MYQLTSGNCVVRVADGATIPADDGNVDYRDYEAWLALGNTPEAAPVIPPPSEPTLADLQAQITAVTAQLNALANAS